MQDRLASFKAGILDGKPIKWKYKTPTMISMARSFYSFDPERGLTDQVCCSECGLKLAKWQKFGSSPLERHAKINLSCFVSSLGELSLNVNANAALTLSDVITACRNSYTGSPLEHLSLQLASEGFIYMKTNCNSTETVGCISCLCFPQNGQDNPKHKGKCKLAQILSDLGEAQFDGNHDDSGLISECDSSKLDSDPQVSKPSPPPTVLELLHNLKVGRVNPRKENACEALEILAEKVKTYFDDMLVYYAQDPTTFHINVEALHAQSLQNFAANSTNLIRHETENIVETLIVGSLCD